MSIRIERKQRREKRIVEWLSWMTDEASKIAKENPELSMLEVLKRLNVKLNGKLVLKKAPLGELVFVREAAARFMSLIDKCSKKAGTNHKADCTGD
jgi:hypothetical protein